MDAGRVVRRAYAKVNLALSVGPPEPKGSPLAGFHPIVSWMHAIELWDDVTLWRAAPGAGPGSARCLTGWAHDAPRPSEIDWPGESDLGVRAVAALEKESGRPLPVALQVVKRIPVGGGLGGGSADAAAALIGVNELHGLDLSAERLAAVSRGLGSDVAYFMDDGAGAGPPRPAVVTRMGDRVERTARATGGLVLILPPFGCPTGAVYTAYDSLGPSALRDAEVRALAAGAHAPGARLFNDLAAAAERVEPRLAAVRLAAERVAGLGNVHMSGSGSTLFVIPGPDGDAIARKLRAELPDCVIAAASLV